MMRLVIIALVGMLAGADADAGDYYKALIESRTALAEAMATVGGAQTCGLKGNLGILAAIAALNVPDAEEGAFEAELTRQNDAANATRAKDLTGWCLAAVRRFGPHGTDMPGLLVAPEPHARKD
jgi:hypothetical protein